MLTDDIPPDMHDTDAARRDTLNSLSNRRSGITSDLGLSEKIRALHRTRSSQAEGTRPLL
jgi:hypothetical protein